MPVHVIFRCDFCGATPDRPTRDALERSLRELGFGEYLDIHPGRWLLWLGGGPLGRRRYACAAHRGELTADVREHYGTVAAHPWKRPPYPTTLRSADTERAIRAGGLAGRSRWALGRTSSRSDGRRAELPRSIRRMSADRPALGD